jgi:hypothetical protein
MSASKNIANADGMNCIAEPIKLNFTQARAADCRRSEILPCILFPRFDELDECIDLCAQRIIGKIDAVEVQHARYR